MGGCLCGPLLSHPVVLCCAVGLFLSVVLSAFRPSSGPGSLWFCLFAFFALYLGQTDYSVSGLVLERGPGGLSYCNCLTTMGFKPMTTM